MNNKVKKSINIIVKSFEDETIPEAIAFSMFPMTDIPCSKWSLNNRIITFFNKTEDARGFRQWNKVGRHVKKHAGVR